MAAQEIGSLFVALGLDSAVFTAGVKQVQAVSGKLQKGLEGIATRAEAMGKKLSVVSAGMAAVGLAVGGLVKSTASAAAEIDRQSQVANASTDEFQRWAKGSEKVGISQEKLADILKDVNDRVGEFNATGAGPMKDFFENVAPKVGVTADAFKDLSGPEALQLYVSSLEKAGLSQQEMTFYLEAMASDATALIPLLANGGAEMTRFGDAAANAGAIMSPALIAGSKTFIEKMGELSLAFEGLRNRLAEVVLPVVNQFMDVLLTHGVPAMQSMVTGLESLITWFGDLSGPVQGAAAVIALALGTGGPVLLAVAALSRGFALLLGTGPIGLFIGAAALAVAAWQVWGDDIKRVVGVAIDFVVEKFNAVIGAIQSAITWAKDLSVKLAEALGFGRELQLQRDMGFGFVDGKPNPNAAGMGSDAASGLVKGFGAGMKSSEAELKEYLDSHLINPTKDHLGIQSPSRVFMAIGDFITQGLGLGIQQGTPQVASAMAGVTAAISDTGGMTESLQKFSDTAKDIFSRVAFQGEKLGDVLKSIAASWLGNAANSLMGSAFDQLFGIGSNANGTNNWRGGLTHVNERGGEIMNLPSGTQIIPHDVSKRMVDRSGGAGQVEIIIRQEPGAVAEIARNEAGAVFRMGIGEYDRQALPARVAQINSDPRRRG